MVRIFQVEGLCKVPTGVPAGHCFYGVYGSYSLHAGILKPPASLILSIPRTKAGTVYVWTCLVLGMGMCDIRMTG